MASIRATSVEVTNSPNPLKLLGKSGTRYHFSRLHRDRHTTNQASAPDSQPFLVTKNLIDSLLCKSPYMYSFNLPLTQQARILRHYCCTPMHLRMAFLCYRTLTLDTLDSFGVSPVWYGPHTHVQTSLSNSLGQLPCQRCSPTT